MMKIIKKPYLNKTTKQYSVSIPKKMLPNKLRYSNNLFFEIKAFKTGDKK